MPSELAQDDALVQEFLTESEEMLQRMDQDLVALETAPTDAELLNRIFRAIHTIKGTSSFLGFDDLVSVTHRTEDVLNAMRRGDLLLTKAIMDVLLRATDQVRRMLEDIRTKSVCQYDLQPLVAELQVLLAPPPPLAAASEAPEQPRPRLGEILVKENILRPDQLTESLKQVAAKGQRLGDILIEQGLATKSQVEQALAKQTVAAEASASTMRVDVRKLDDLINLVGELVLERNRLLQIARDFAGQRLSTEKLQETLTESTARLSFVTDELQGASLRTRMVPIETVFRKFPRLVRDVARSLGKDVELVLHGQETELDKTMVEQIADPLIHLVRNSLDHGIESPEAREAAGKPKTGKLRLEARQEGDHIVIVIQDDGGGIDPERIGNKAVEKGLITPERLKTMSRTEILDLIFLPGFSTAEKANNISGRGVGMDVVRTNMKKMNGTVEMESTVGKGTSVLLKLPLTMAILPVLLVEVAAEVYALPLRSVVETLRLNPSDIHAVEGREVLRMRDRTVPLLRLSNLFGVAVENSEVAKRVVLLWVADTRVALLVDRLVGQEATVVKPLGNFLRNCSSIAGATISGDGRVRLVIDPASLLGLAETNVTPKVH